MTLGNVEVMFSHKYEPKHQTSKLKTTKTGETKGGLTTVVGIPKATTVVIKVGDKTFTAKAACSPKDDFKFEVGRKLALKKALAQVTTLSKEERRRMWDEYNKLKPGGRW